MALANGYRRFGPCISSPQGAIGLHYVNRRLFASVAIIPRQPEAIVYMPRPGGGLRLGAVAYAKVGGDRPRLWGVPFKGPMIEAGMPKHYDLHVWIWQPNPRGLFAQFNPSIRC